MRDALLLMRTISSDRESDASPRCARGWEVMGSRVVYAFQCSVCVLHHSDVRTIWETHSGGAEVMRRGSVSVMYYFRCGPSRVIGRVMHHSDVRTIWETRGRAGGSDP